MTLNSKNISAHRSGLNFLRVRRVNYRLMIRRRRQLKRNVQTEVLAV